MKLVIDQPHSNLDFSVTYLDSILLTGSFEKFEGTIETPDEFFTSGSVFIRIEVSSIRTNNSERDKVLLTNQFFDAGIHPNMTFRSTHWEKLNEDIIRVTGDLTIKGVSRPLVASVSYNGSNVDMQGNTSYFFSFSTTIDRTLFGMQPAPVTSLGAQLLSNTVNIQAAFSFQILR